MKDETDIESDTRAGKKPSRPRTRAVTPLRLKVGEIHVRGGAKSSYQAITKAGGSHWTARAPKRNRLEPAATMHDYLSTVPARTLQDLDGKAITAIDEYLSDPNAPASIRAPLAVQVVRTRREFHPDDDAADPITLQHKLTAVHQRLRAHADGLRLGGCPPERLERVESRLSMIRQEIARLTAMERGVRPGPRFLLGRGYPEAAD